MSSDQKILVLGIGNDILSDDGIGPHLIRDLSHQVNYPHVVFETSCLGGMEVLELICHYNTVIILDAIKTRGGIPGTVYLMQPEDFRETAHLSSFHDVNFLTALKLGHHLDMSLPEKIWIIAIEILEDLEFSASLTPPLQAKYPAILAEIVEFVEQASMKKASVD